MFKSKLKFHPLIIQLVMLFLIGFFPVTASSEDGVTDTEIVIGGVMDLKGDSSGLGQGMMAGIKAALDNETVGQRSIRFVVENDFYSPDKTVEGTQKLIKEKVFAFAGNVGTPTAKVSLPILAENGIPAVGFFTGAGLLRPGVGDIINYRASYVQEIKAVIETALRNGLKPEAICAFVQNDAYGMAGVAGIIKALQSVAGMTVVTDVLEKILALQGTQATRNNIGPVGTYTRNTLAARSGYDSLKFWEQTQGTSCGLVVTVGAYAPIARFIAYATGKGEPWIYSAVSFTGAENLADTLNRFGVSERVIMTQVVPLEGQSDVVPAIIESAKIDLGEQYGLVSQEGYIVGKMLLHGLHTIDQEGLQITRRNFVDVFKGLKLNLGDLLLDFSDDNQGSDLVISTGLANRSWQVMDDANWRRWIN